MRTSARGLVAGETKIHRRGDRLNSAENGTFLRLEQHPTRGPIVWYRPDARWCERPIPLANVAIVRSKRHA